MRPPHRPGEGCDGAVDLDRELVDVGVFEGEVVGVHEVLPEPEGVQGRLFTREESRPQDALRPCERCASPRVRARDPEARADRVPGARVDRGPVPLPTSPFSRWRPGCRGTAGGFGENSASLWRWCGRWRPTPPNAARPAPVVVRPARRADRLADLRVWQRCAGLTAGERAARQRAQPTTRLVPSSRCALRCDVPQPSIDSLAALASSTKWAAAGRARAWRPAWHRERGWAEPLSPGMGHYAPTSPIRKLKPPHRTERASTSPIRKLRLSDPGSAAAAPVISAERR